jgi:prevent-host-death family protein
MASANLGARHVSLYEAKTHLSELGERAAAGEEIIVTKHGKPRFRLVAAVTLAPRPVPGGVRGGVASAAALDRLAEIDWFAPDDDLERMFGEAVE